MNLKHNGKSLHKTKRGHPDARVENSQRKTGPEVGVMWPRAKGYQGPAEAERDRKGSSLETSEGIMTLLTLRSWTFSLQNFKKIHFYWFKASSL